MTLLKLDTIYFKSEIYPSVKYLMHCSHTAFTHEYLNQQAVRSVCRGNGLISSSLTSCPGQYHIGKVVEWTVEKVTVSNWIFHHHSVMLLFAKSKWIYQAKWNKWHLHKRAHTHIYTDERSEEDKKMRETEKEKLKKTKHQSISR